MLKDSLLVIDDDKSILAALTMSLEAEYDVYTARSGAEGLALVRDKEPDLVLLDIGLPDTSGVDLIEQIKNADPKSVVIMVTAVEETKMVVKALKLGAYDYLVKPIDVRELKITLKNALELKSLKDQIGRLQKQNKARWGVDLVGKSPGFKKLIETARQAAKCVDTPVLLLGETGTGKNALARAIHFNFTENPGPFIAVNCSAITHDLFESEFFGYERGSFTGAKNEGKIGRFEEAAGGTLLLDEIGSMSLTSQSKLLGVLDERLFYRVGGNQGHRVSAKIIAATNSDLDKAVEEGSFRQDLFFRLNVVCIRIPPLRERPEDILPLAEQFIAGFNKKYDKKLSSLSPEARKILLEYPWPGNVRELRNTLERIVLLESGSTILPHHFAFIHHPHGEASPEKIEALGVLKSSEEMINKAILKALAGSGGNVMQASRLLHIPAHKIRYRIKKYRLMPDSSKLEVPRTGRGA